jgi:hypothetical protein
LLKIIYRQDNQKFGFKIVEEFVGKYNGHDVTVLRLALRPELEAWKKEIELATGKLF